MNLLHPDRAKELYEPLGRLILAYSSLEAELNGLAEALCNIGYVAEIGPSESRLWPDQPLRVRLDGLRELCIACFEDDHEWASRSAKAFAGAERATAARHELIHGHWWWNGRTGTVQTVRWPKAKGARRVSPPEFTDQDPLAVDSATQALDQAAAELGVIAHQVKVRRGNAKPVTP